MQYLYQDGDDYYFMDTVTFDQIHITSEALGESVNYLKAEMTISVEFYGTEPVGIELPTDRGSEGDRHGSGHQGRDGERAGQAGDARNRPGRAGAAVREPRRLDSRQHRDRGILVPGLNQFLTPKTANSPRPELFGGVGS